MHVANMGHYHNGKGRVPSLTAGGRRSDGLRGTAESVWREHIKRSLTITMLCCRKSGKRHRQQQKQPPGTDRRPTQIHLIKLFSVVHFYLSGATGWLPGLGFLTAACYSPRPSFPLGPLIHRCGPDNVAMPSLVALPWQMLIIQSLNFAICIHSTYEHGIIFEWKPLRSAKQASQWL